MKKPSPNLTEIAKTYEPTPDERAAADALHARRTKTPRIKASRTEGGVDISLDHPSRAYGKALLMSALGTTETDFLMGILNQLVESSTVGQRVDELRVNFLLSVIKGVEPRDQVETMLAMQMAAVHTLTMSFVQRLTNAETLVQQDCSERALNKLARTYALQMEALKRYRSTGEQKVTVEHVTVNEGGKAIVGNVTHGAPDQPKKPAMVT